MQRKVRRVFERIEAEMEANVPWVTIDASLDRDTVEKNIWTVVEPLVQGVNEPVRKLWSKKLGTEG